MLDAQTWSEATLVRRCVAGERLAWRHLHRRLYPVARAFLGRLGVSGSELDDACQDVFLQLFRALPTFRGQAELKTWLYRLCVTVAGRIRRRVQLVRGILEALKLGRTESTTEPPGGNADLEQRLLARGLASLGHRERAVFVMYELEGLSGKEISKVVGSPEATIYRQLHYARRAFRAALGAGKATHPPQLGEQPWKHRAAGAPPERHVCELPAGVCCTEGLLCGGRTG